MPSRSWQYSWEIGYPHSHSLLALGAPCWVLMSHEHVYAALLAHSAACLIARLHDTECGVKGFRSVVSTLSSRLPLQLLIQSGIHTRDCQYTTAVSRVRKCLDDAISVVFPTEYYVR